MSEFTNEQLFSCCENNEAPNWANYEGLILGGCVECVSNPEAPPETQEKEILGGQDREDAQFFTIYGWNEGSRAITDIDDLDQAISILQHLSETSGLEYWINC